MKETLDKTSLGALSPGGQGEPRARGHPGHATWAATWCRGTSTGSVTSCAAAPASTGRSSRSRCRPGLESPISWTRGRSRSTASRSRSCHVDDARRTFTVSLIPETLDRTTLGSKGVGEPVNLEVDVVAKYVERMLAARLPVQPRRRSREPPGQDPPRHRRGGAGRHGSGQARHRGRRRGPRERGRHHLRGQQGHSRADGVDHPPQLRGHLRADAGRDARPPRDPADDAAQP